MTIHLRPYQEQALEAEARHRAEHPDETRLAIVMATGLGKTIVMAERARRFLDTDASCYGSPKRVLVLVHTDELAQQAEAKVCLVVQGDRERAWSVGAVKAERDEVDADIIIGSVQTLANPERRARLMDVGLVIVDECHHATAASYQAIMRHYGCLGCICLPYRAGGDGPEQACPEHGYGPAIVPALGLTATLERSDGAGLGEIWQSVVFTRDTSWAVRKGHLVQPIGYRLEIEDSQDPDWGFSRNPAELDTQLADSIAPHRVVEKWLELAKDRPTVLFAPLVRSARAFAFAFRRAGIAATWIHGAMSPGDRRGSLRQYESGEVQVLCNAMVLTEGWDSPRTKCVIVARPTQSRPLFIQMAGRGLRPDPLKPVEEQDCILIAVADATTDMCTVADLSDRALDRKAEGPLTAMEDQWDIGKDLEEEQRHWAGKVDATQFDPIVSRPSKVWRTTKGGIPFLPISKDEEYVFVVGTSIYQRVEVLTALGRYKVTRLHRDLPDLGLALQLAEDEATDRGGDIGALLADRSRPWRKGVPTAKQQEEAQRLGLGRELITIMESPRSGKAGKVSDLISRVKATRAIDPMVEKIKERTMGE